MLLRWKKDSISELALRVRWIIVRVSPAACCFPYYAFYSWGAVLGLTLALWTVAITVLLVSIAWDPKDLFGNGLNQFPPDFTMTLAHMGIAVFVTGTTLTSVYSVEKDVRIAPSDTIDMSGYIFEFHGVKQTPGPSYIAKQGFVTVSHEGKEVAKLKPQKRVYQVQKMPMTKPPLMQVFSGIYLSLSVNPWVIRVPGVCAFITNHSFAGYGWVRYSWQWVVCARLVTGVIAKRNLRSD